MKIPKLKKISCAFVVVFTIVVIVCMFSFSASAEECYDDVTESISKKAPIDGSSIKFENATVVYDGNSHSLQVTGDPDILAMLDVTYDGNGKTFIGTYAVTATITVKDEYAGNYTYYDELTAILTITGDKKNNYEIKDNNDIIVNVEVPGGLDPDNIIAGGITTDVNSTCEVNGKDAEVLVAYDIYFTKGGDVINLNPQDFKVRLLIPANYRHLEDDELMIIHIKNDGSIEVMDATREGDYMVFETGHFSVYAIASYNTVESSSWFISIIIAIIDFLKSLFRLN